MDSLKDAESGAASPPARYMAPWSATSTAPCCTAASMAHPADSKNKSGKLRLRYECAPMSFIMEQVCGLRGGSLRYMVICLLHVLLPSTAWAVNVAPLFIQQVFYSTALMQTWPGG